VTDPGERFHLVTIQRATTTTDNYGGEVRNWSNVGTAYAAVLYGTGQERREAAQDNATQAATFNFDWNPTVAAIRPTDRLFCFDTHWDVSSAVVIGGNREVHVTAIANLDEDPDDYET
jgi:head-tail adaptor